MKILLFALLLFNSCNAMETHQESQSHNVTVNVNVKDKDSPKEDSGCQIKSNCQIHKYKILAVISGGSLLTSIAALIVHFTTC